MANLDTPLKRLSGIHVSCPWRGLLPLPDGAISQADRQTVPFMYSGVLADPPNPDVDEFSIGGREIIERFQPVKVVTAATVIWPWGMNKKTGGTDGP